MSKGIGAIADIISCDDDKIIYEYGGYNCNDNNYLNPDNILDGKIEIQTRCLLDSNIDIGEMLEQRLIEFQNCSNCWKATEDDIEVDYMILRILFIFFQKYREEGKVPEKIGFYS